MDDDSPASTERLLALLYEAGRRPSIGDLRRAGEESGAFAISFDPGDRADWAELLITGLTFDVAGLAPGQAAALPEIAHRFGIGTLQDGALEAIVVRPGIHLAGAAAMLPVVRGATALAAALAHRTAAVAAVWIPARSAMGADYFAAVIGDWLAGGAFPALGLTALVPSATGIGSEGLTFFTGQELELATAQGRDAAQAGRIAVRLVHLLVEHGHLTAPVRLAGPGGEPLLAEPLGDGTRVGVGYRQ